MFEPSRSDARLLKRALRQGWSVPTPLRKQIIEVLGAITSDASARPRERTSAALALLQASRVELDAIRVAQEAQYEDLIRRLRALEEQDDAGLAEAAGGD
jgi:hypothetical protein